jgi:hypothetical protein
MTFKNWCVADEGIDRVEVLADVKNQLINTMTDYDSTGVVLSDGSITYQEANPNEMKQMNLVVGDVTRKTTISSAILINEKDITLDSSLFTVAQP